MSGLQNLLVSILPSGWRESLETGSRSWRTRCSGCGYESNVWDMGGIRWKAAGSSRRLMRCTSCARLGMHRVYRP